ncbi:MAG: alpha/beta hydrolase [Gammaproteobacteria bacterium]|nr:alpha/beta hydrolase [Gammaproteobacteria bacterium]MBI5616921.1 alpha/beta hydrolase [Gammaproteobacteria bacterium]
MSRGEYTAQWNPAVPARTLRLDDGTSLRYVRTGQGRPLLLLHTLRTQLDYFEQLVPRLAAGYDVIAVDLPGHGQSDIPKAAYDEPMFRAAIRELVVKLDLQDLTIAGESIGGVLALTLAAELPERVARVVALNPYDYGEEFGGGIRRARHGWIIGLYAIFGPYTIAPKPLLAAVMRGGFHDAQALPASLLDELHRTGLRPGYGRAQYALLKHWRSWEAARSRYAGIRAPVTLVYGSDDWSNGAERERDRSGIPGARYFEIPAAGHFSALEAPATVAGIILADQGGTTP